MTSITLEQLRGIQYNTTSTAENKRLTAIIDLVEFQRGMYGDNFKSEITNNHGHVTLTVQG